MLAVVFRLLRALWRGFVLRPHRRVPAVRGRYLPIVRPRCRGHVVLVTPSRAAGS